MHAVRDVSFTVAKGETLGLVGESGSGKSVTAQALLGLTELPGKITSGDVRWKGDSLVNDADATLARVRGNEIAMVFQDPMTSLNPVFTIGMQITEVLRRHMGMNSSSRLGSAPSNCSTSSASPIPATGSSSTRTRCREACVSACSSPWRSPASRNC